MKLLVPGERNDVVEKPGYGMSREKTGWQIQCIYEKFITNPTIEQSLLFPGFES